MRDSFKEMKSSKVYEKKPPKKKKEKKIDVIDESELAALENENKFSDLKDLKVNEEFDMDEAVLILDSLIKQNTNKKETKISPNTPKNNTSLENKNENLINFKNKLDSISEELGIGKDLLDKDLNSKINEKSENSSNQKEEIQKEYIFSANESQKNNNKDVDVDVDENVETSVEFSKNLIEDKDILNDLNKEFESMFKINEEEYLQEMENIEEIIEKSNKTENRDSSYIRKQTKDLKKLSSDNFERILKSLDNFYSKSEVPYIDVSFTFIFRYTMII